MKKALRIGYNRYYCDENFAEHIAFVKKNIANINEITLFAEFCHHGYWTEEFDRENARIITDRIKQYRAAGVKSVGINILNTRGHTLDGWDYLPKAPLQHEVDSNGEEHPACLCIANEAFEEYIAKRYAIYAATGADFIWEDDDMRPGNGVVGCMCDSCIAKFNAQYGHDFDRPTLVEKRKTDPEIKKQWGAFQAKLFIRLVQVIEKAIHNVNPAIQIGSMDFMNDPAVVRAAGASKYRPGGGFYDERAPWEVFWKSENVQAQMALMCPENIKDIQYEYEAFNYQSLDKSNHITRLETSLALMSGCNGVLYNNDIFYDRQSLLDMLAENGKMWDNLTHRNENSRPGGVFVVPGPALNSLKQVGIPTTLDFEGAVGCYIMGKQWERFDDVFIEKILQKGAMTDGEGLQVLTARGFAVGGKVKKAYQSGMAERFAAHKLAGKYAGHYRDAFMNFAYYHNNTGCAYELEPDEGAEVVSNLESITHEKLGCSLYIYEKDGKRFAADGYFFPNSCRTYGKKFQLNGVLDWVCGGQLPVLVLDETIKIMPTVRVQENGDFTALLVNASLDKAGKFTCRVLSGKPVYQMLPCGKLKKLKQKACGRYRLVIVDGLDSWDGVLLTNRK